MSLYIRLFNSYWQHRKTIKLVSLIGSDGYWIMPRLWSYAAENQPDGNFEKYSANEIALLIGYNKDATSMLQALQQASFLDNMQLHDWHDWNSYHSVFADRAKKAANKKWEKIRNKKGKEKKRKETSIATSMLQASVKHKYGEYQHVMLTDFQLEKLKKQFPDYENWIKKLDEGIQLKGYSYKDHYLAILNWAKKENKNLKQNNDPFTQHKSIGG